VGFWVVVALILAGVGCALFVVLSFEGNRVQQAAAGLVVLAIPLVIWAFDRWFDEGCYEGYEDCGVLDWVWLAPLLYCAIGLLGFAMAYRWARRTSSDRSRPPS
jgi:hypothetical protein